MAERKSNKSQVKLERGFMRDSDKVTFKFDGSKGKQASKHELFEIKQNGTGSHQYSPLKSDVYGDLIMKLAEYLNVMSDMEFQRKIDEQQHIIDAALIKWHTLEEKYKEDGSLSNQEKTRLEKHKREVKDAKAQQELLVKKMINHYRDFMGDKANSFDDIVHKTLQSPVAHEQTHYKLKKVAFCYDTQSNTLGDRLEDYDDKANDPNFSDPEVTFRWKMVPYTVTATTKRGISIDGLRYCIHLHVCHVGGYGRAEIQKRYMTNHALFPNDLTMEVKAFAEMLVDMNKNIPLLPSLKDHPEYINNDDVPQGNLPLSNLEMCTILMDCMPRDVQLAFQAKNPTDQLRFDIMLLAEELQPLVRECAGTRKLTKQVTGSGGGGNTNPKNTPRDNRSNRNSGNRNNGNRNQPTEETGMFCKMCKENKKNHKTHNSTDCRIYNLDGTMKPRKQLFTQEQVDKILDAAEQRRGEHYRHEKSSSGRRSSRNRDRSRSRSCSRSHY